MEHQSSQHNDRFAASGPTPADDVLACLARDGDWETAGREAAWLLLNRCHSLVVRRARLTASRFNVRQSDEFVEAVVGRVQDSLIGKKRVRQLREAAAWPKFLSVSVDRLAIDEWRANWNPSKNPVLTSDPADIPDQSDLGGGARQIEVNRILQQALDRLRSQDALGRRQALALVLRHLQGMSPVEIAARMNDVNPDTVTRYVKDAKTRLFDLLREYGCDVADELASEDAQRKREGNERRDRD